MAFRQPTLVELYGLRQALLPVTCLIAAPHSGETGPRFLFLWPIKGVGVGELTILGFKVPTIQGLMEDIILQTYISIFATKVVESIANCLSIRPLRLSSP